MTRLSLIAALSISLASLGFAEGVKQDKIAPVQEEIVQQEEEQSEKARDSNIVSSEELADDPLLAKLFGF